MKFSKLAGLVFAAFSATVWRILPSSSSSATWWPRILPRVWRPTSSPKKADELTKSTVKVEVYANSTLYKDKEELEALQLGAVRCWRRRWPSSARWGEGIRGLRSALHLRRLQRAAQSHPGRDRPATARAGTQGHQGPGLLGQRFQVLLRQHPIKTPATSRARRCASSRPKVLEEKSGPSAPCPR